MQYIFFLLNNCPEKTTNYRLSGELFLPRISSKKATNPLNRGKQQMKIKKVQKWNTKSLGGSYWPLVARFLWLWDRTWGGAGPKSTRPSQPKFKAKARTVKEDEERRRRNEIDSFFLFNRKGRTWRRARQLNQSETDLCLSFVVWFVKDCFPNRKYTHSHIPAGTHSSRCQRLEFDMVSFN